jgi:methyl-accepting chemotaxis protein
MRKNYFVKPGLQIRNLLFVGFTIFASVSLVYIGIEKTIVKAFNTLQIPATDIAASVSAMRTSLVRIILVLIGGLGVLGVYTFHRFTGPLFALERSIEKLRSGDLNTHIAIRKNDHLHDLEEKLRELVKAYKDMILQDRKRAETISSLLGEIIERGQGHPLSQSQIQELADIKRQASLMTQQFKI